MNIFMVLVTDIPLFVFIDNIMLRNKVDIWSYIWIHMNTCDKTCETQEWTLKWQINLQKPRKTLGDKKSCKPTEGHLGDESQQNPRGYPWWQKGSKPKGEPLGDEKLWNNRGTLWWQACTTQGWTMGDNKFENQGETVDLQNLQN